MELLGLLPGFGSLIWTVLAFVVALSIIVFVHEYGHYIVGRWSGIHAEVFSIGFGPVLLSRHDKRGTRWQIAALPFGGYVKFLGDADAASGKDGDTLSALNAAERRRTMHGAPLWARAATVAAGPAFNFILAMVIFTAMVLWQGIASDEPIVGSADPLPHVAQPLLAGDRIMAIDGKPTETLAEVFKVADALPPAAGVIYQVKREGQVIDINGPFPFPALVKAVQPQTAAYDAGIQTGDVVTAINGTPVQAFSQLREIVGPSDGAEVTLQLWRAGSQIETTLKPRRMDLPRPDGSFETRWLIGLSGGLAFMPETRQPGPIEAVGIAGDQVVMLVKTSLSGLWHMVTGAISSCNLQGPLGIAETSGAAASQGAQSFIWFLAVLSVAVGLMNLFPVPVLDGGHLVFFAYEAVTGKPPSEKALGRLMQIGLALLLTMMVFALTNDIFCP